MTQNCDLLRFIPGQPGYHRGMYKGTFLRYIERFKPPPSRSDSTRRFFGRLIVDWLVISPPPLDGWGTNIHAGPAAGGWGTLPPPPS